MTIVIISVIGACFISVFLIAALVFLSLKVMDVLKIKNNTAAEHRHQVMKAFAGSSARSDIESER